eukprot:767600-Hanusia_phi.AAC.5
MACQGHDRVQRLVTMCMKLGTRRARGQLRGCGGKACRSSERLRLRVRPGNRRESISSLT